jgi:hypothetical protein
MNLRFLFVMTRLQVHEAEISVSNGKMAVL